MNYSNHKNIQLAYEAVYNQDLCESMEDLGLIEGDNNLNKNFTKTSTETNTDRDLELYNIILEYLIQEGYADTLGSAEIIFENMSEEWMEEIINEARDGYGPDEKFKTPEDRIKRPGTDVPPAIRGRYDKPISRYSPIGKQRSRTASQVTRATEGPGEPQAVTMPRERKPKRVIPSRLDKKK